MLMVGYILLTVESALGKTMQEVLNFAIEQATLQSSCTLAGVTGLQEVWEPRVSLSIQAVGPSSTTLLGKPAGS